MRERGRQEKRWDSSDVLGDCQRSKQGQKKARGTGTDGLIR